ncbi:MAG: hypothetical protein NTZ09_17335 [Candidatus Hydrogenedentes bacterium]|nr:hypothetical protein [Candidatus Hydrogenedentota bacterium]
MKDILRYVVVAVTVAATGAWAESSKELLDLFCAHQEAARAKISSYSFDMSMTLTRENKQEKEIGGCAYKEIRKGESLWIETTQQAETVKKAQNEKTSVNQTERVVKNNEYVATWSVGSGTAYLYEHASKDRLSEDGDVTLQLTRLVDLMKYGFGTGQRMLSEVIKDTSIKAEWTVRAFTTQSGKQLYVVERGYVEGEGKGKPEVQYVIDPDMSFLITRVIAYHPNGSVRVDDEVTVQEVKPGLFFPVRLIQRSFMNEGESDWKALAPVTLDDVLSNSYLNSYESALVMRTATCDITDLKLDVDVPPEQFQLDALTLPASVDVIKKYSDGSEEILKYYQGKWIEESVLEGLVPTAQSIGADAIDDSKKDMLDASLETISTPEATVTSENVAASSSHLRVGMITGLVSVIALVAVAVIAVRYKRRKKPLRGKTK